MSIARILAALGLLAAAAAANAEVSSTWTLANDYNLRGFSQSAKDLALQASLDYAATNGWYIGAWASNIDFGSGVDADYELDLYTGFAGGAEDGLGWDVGLIHYTYPGESDLNYIELYGGIAYGWFAGKLWYSNDFGGDSTNGDTSSVYLEANATWPLPRNFSLLLHAGLSTGDYWDDVNGDDVIDYAVGVGYEIGSYSLALKWIDTQTDVVVRDDVFNNEDRVLFTLQTRFPQRKE